MSSVMPPSATLSNPESLDDELKELLSGLAIPDRDQLFNKLRDFIETKYISEPKFTVGESGMLLRKIVIEVIDF